MVNRPRGNQFHFDPATYLGTIRAEVPAYDERQDAVAEATAGIQAERVLELGVGMGKRLGGCSTSILRRNFVLGDVVVPGDPADVVTPIDGAYDQPSTVDHLVRWLAAAGFNAEVVWARQDLCVIVADSPS